MLQGSNTEDRRREGDAKSTSMLSSDNPNFESQQMNSLRKDYKQGHREKLHCISQRLKFGALEPEDIMTMHRSYLLVS